MIESSEKKIAEELAKAGTDPVLIEKLKKDRITVDKELLPMEFLLKYSPPESGGARGGLNTGNCALVQTTPPTGTPPDSGGEMNTPHIINLNQYHYENL